MGLSKKPIFFTTKYTKKIHKDHNILITNQYSLCPIV